MSAVNPRIAPLATSRSIRRLTAGAESPTSAPISASVARALRSRQLMTLLSIPSIRSLHAINRRWSGQDATYGLETRKRTRLFVNSPPHSVPATGAYPPRSEFPVTAVLPQPRAASSLERPAPPRRYLMCRPEHFDVSYAINPWMDVARGVDRELALQ